jgi:type I restriction enzyme S subunit
MSTSAETIEIEKTAETGEDLPEGWVGTTLREGVSINYGKGLKESVRKPGPVPVYGSNGVVGTHSKALTNGPTIVIGRKGTVGAVHFSAVPCWPIDTTYYIDNLAEVDISYLSDWLQTLSLGELDTSTAVPGLNRDDLYDQELLLGPRLEQKRIAKRIDELRDIITSTGRRLNKSAASLKQLRQTILAAACSGKLTEDWRAQYPDVESGPGLLARVLRDRKSATAAASMRGCDITETPEEWTWRVWMH